MFAHINTEKVILKSAFTSARNSARKLMTWATNHFTTFKVKTNSLDKSSLTVSVRITEL